MLNLYGDISRSVLRKRSYVFADPRHVLRSSSLRYAPSSVSTMHGAGCHTICPCHTIFRVCSGRGGWTEPGNSIVGGPERTRTQAGWSAQPIPRVGNSQSVKTTGIGDVRGYDGDKNESRCTHYASDKSPNRVFKSESGPDRAIIPLLPKGIQGILPLITHLQVD